MRVRQKELRRARKRREERIKAAAKGVAITGAGAATPVAAQKISRPVTRRSSESAPTRPQNDRGPRRDGGRRDGGDRGPRPPRERAPQTEAPAAETPATETPAAEG